MCVKKALKFAAVETYSGSIGGDQILRSISSYGKWTFKIKHKFIRKFTEVFINTLIETSKINNKINENTY